MDYVTNDGTALDGDDFTAQSGTITFNSTTPSFNIDVPITDDNVIEAQENFTVVLSNVQSNLGVGLIGPDTATGTINDDDSNGPNEGIAVEDFTVDEDSGTAQFVISYTGNTVQDAFNVNFTVTDGTAIDPDDYNVANTDTFVTFPDNTDSGDTQIVTINIEDDLLIEDAETLDIALAFDAVPPAGINMLDGDATGTIIDNDANGPNEGIAVADFTVDEDAGTAQFVISYTGNTVQDAFNVNFTVTDGTAIDPDDYNVANTDTFVTFPGNTASGDTQIVTINIEDDLLIEDAETLDIALAFDAMPPAGINMLDGDATGTIIDNEMPGPDDGVSVTGFSVSEGIGTASFIITYTGFTVQDAFDVSFTVTDGTAVNPDDYTVTTATVSFPPNTVDGSTQEVIITIVDDTITESSEDLTIQLDGTSTILVPLGTPDNAIGIITDNDMPGPNDGLYIDDLQINEDAGTAMVTVRVQGSFGAFTVDYATNNGAGSATATEGGIDYNETSGTLSFAEGQASTTFEVVIVDDCLIEGTEFFFANLLNAPDNVPVRDSNATITILDDELPITASDFEQEITIVCGEDIPEVPQLTFSGGNGEFTVDFTEEVQASGTGTDDFLIVRTWNVSDSCGNTATFEQLIVVLQPTLEEVFLDICVEDDPADLVDFLPESFDTNGIFETEIQGSFLSGPLFSPSGLEEGEYLVRYSSTEGTCKYFVDFFVTVNRDCVECDVDANIGNLQNRDRQW